MAPKFNLRTAGTDTTDLEYKGSKLTFLDMDNNFINFTTGSAGHNININNITAQGNINVPSGDIVVNNGVVSAESIETGDLIVDGQVQITQNLFVDGNTTIGGDIQINSGFTRITGKTRVLLGNVIENFPVTAAGTSLSLPHPSGELSTYMSDQIKKGKKFKVTFEFTKVGVSYDSATVSLKRKDSSTALIYPYTSFSIEDSNTIPRTLFSWGEHSTHPTTSISATTNKDGEKIFISYYIFSDFLSLDRVIFSKDGSSEGGYGSILSLNSSYGNEIEFAFNSQTDSNFTVTVVWEEILEITEVL